MSRKAKSFVVVTLSVLLLFALVACGDDDRVSLSQYNQIEIDMTRTEVRRIFGSNGTQMSTSSFGGITTSIYSWEGRGSVGANVLITFQDNRVVSKAQAGLR